jgi:hypothetical protein
MARPTTPPAWRRPFLRELARTGSVKLAAELCAVDRKTPYAARRGNPAFAASWQRALATARESLSAEFPSRLREESGVGTPGDRHTGSPAHPQSTPRAGAWMKWPSLLPGEIVHASKAGHPCIVRPGPGRLTVQAERAFLAELAATANVQAAARAAGVSTQALYKRRRKRPALAEQWRLALAEGRLRLDLLLIHVPTATLDPEPEVEPREAPAMSVEQALHLFKLHRASQRGGKPQRYGWRQQLPDIEEVRAEVVRRLAAIQKARGRQARG